MCFVFLETTYGCSDEIVAVDVINLKVCCCYQRDSRKRKASVLEDKPVDDVIPEFDPRLDLARDINPDKDGFYNFNVRLVSCYVTFLFHFYFL